MSNIFDHLEDRWFIPDAQIIFPIVFLSDVGSLEGNSALYKDCFDVIKGSCNYIMLPSNITDFNGLIMNKLREFLHQIENHIRRARSENWSEDEFYRRVLSYLRAVNNFGKHLGDLLTYWSNKKSVFWSYVSMDPALVKKRMESLVVDKLGIYDDICDEHEVKFTIEETNHSDTFFIKIRDARNSRSISNSANDADLMILADCIVYSTERLQQGIAYLVTDDNELHGTTLAIVNRPNLIFPEITSGRLSGLEPLKPLRLVGDFRKKGKAKTS